MCFGRSSPHIRKPPPLQEAQLPDSQALETRRRQAAQGARGIGTLLTGPAGVPNSLLNTGGTSLLGG